MAMVTLSTGSIYYETSGIKTSESIVFIGGFSGDHHVWDLVAPIFNEHYQVIVFDNPGGSGQSSVPDESFTIQDYAKTAIELCDSLKIEQAYFVGSSMGGAIVQQLAYHFPERVKKAVICNSFMTATNMAYATYAQAGLDWFHANVSKENLIKASLAWGFSGRFLTKENIALFTEIQLNKPHSQSEMGYRAQLAGLIAFDSSSWLKEIKLPCLFIASDEDAICFPSQIKKMAEQVKNSEYYLFDNSVGHLPHIEQPELFATQVIEFLAK